MGPLTPADAVLAAWTPPESVSLLLAPDGTLHDTFHDGLLDGPGTLTPEDVPLNEALALARCLRCKFPTVDEARQHPVAVEAATALLREPAAPTWADVRTWYVASHSPHAVVPSALDFSLPAVRAVLDVMTRESRVLATRHASLLDHVDLHLAIAAQAVAFPTTPARANRLQSFSFSMLELRAVPQGTEPWLEQARAELAASPLVPGVLAAAPPANAVRAHETEIVELLCFANHAPPAFAYLTLPHLVWDGLAHLGAVCACWDLDHLSLQHRSRVLDTASQLWDPLPSGALHDLESVLTIATDSLT